MGLNRMFQADIKIALVEISLRSLGIVLQNLLDDILELRIIERARTRGNRGFNRSGDQGIQIREPIISKLHRLNQDRIVRVERCPLRSL